MRGGAKIDATRLYRYSLWREWASDAPRIGFVMLNPSTADATVDDATIRRCISFARSWGFGSLEVVNLFAYRVTNPSLLRRVVDPIGPENDYYLLQAGQQSKIMLVGWGNWGTLQNRNREVISLLAQCPLYCLGITQVGHPRHPLYVRRSITPTLFEICGKAERKADAAGKGHNAVELLDAWGCRTPC